MYWVSLSFGKAFATSSGMMMASRFERKVGSTPVGSLKFIARVYLSFASIDSSRAAVNFPRPVIAIQRLTEATTSAEVISLSLWKGMFLRRLNIQFLPSPETSYLSSKNGTGSCLSFFWKSCSNMCHEMLAVIVAVVNDGSSAGGSPMIPTFRVPPFRGSSAGSARRQALQRVGLDFAQKSVSIHRGPPAMCVHTRTYDRPAQGAPVSRPI